LVIFAIGLGVVVLRDPGDSSRADGISGTAPPLTSAPTEPAKTPPPTSAAPTATSSAPAAGVVTVPVVVVPPVPTVPTTIPTTAAPTTPATAPPPLTPAPDPATSALATAQALLDAFAEGRWNDARTLNPGRNESDSFLQQAYGPIEQATIIPASVKALSGGRYDMRFGIVSHELQPAGPQTVLMCSHWQVDTGTQTVRRYDSARLRVEGGFVDPTARANELSTVCASLPLA
jgi:hypothetical protein